MALATALALPIAGTRAATLTPEALTRVTQATFEVVQRKPEIDPLTYEKALPLELVPYRERTDKYRSVGTAFAVAGDRYVTAAHVLAVGAGSQFGLPALRDRDGKIYPITRVLKYSTSEDYAVFTVTGANPVPPLEIRARPALNSAVFAVGNALGEGIVIRDGVYTSDTPEERDGRWDWIRFSAAASPGNSGGPLVDRQGRVIGVVLRKSPSENLNYAVAIQQIESGSSSAATLEYRNKVSFLVLQATSVANDTEHIALPLPIAEFYAAMQKISLALMTRVQLDLLAQHRDEIFPVGKNSEQLLSSFYTAVFPRLVRQRADGVWDAQAPKLETAQLPENGLIESGTGSDGGVLRLKRPDDVALADLAGDSKRYMELLLKGYVLRRQVGSDSVRITSLGAAADESSHLDRWGRPWQIRYWLVPYDDTVVVSTALPTPEGYIAILANVPSAVRELTIANAEAITDFVALAYRGTLSEWGSYLGAAIERPRVFSGMAIAYDERKRFEFKSPRFGLELKPSELAAGPSSVLTLSFNFYRDGDRATWDLAGLTLVDAIPQTRALVVWRHVRPAPGLPDGFKTNWDAVVNGKPPFHGKPYVYNGRALIGATVEASAVRSHQLPVAYTLTLALEGVQNPREMEKVFYDVQRSFYNHEH